MLYLIHNKQKLTIGTYYYNMIYVRRNNEILWNTCNRKNQPSEFKLYQLLTKYYDKKKYIILVGIKLLLIYEEYSRVWGVCTHAVPIILQYIISVITLYTMHVPIFCIYYDLLSTWIIPKCQYYHILWIILYILILLL